MLIVSFALNFPVVRARSEGLRRTGATVATFGFQQNFGFPSRHDYSASTGPSHAASALRTKSRQYFSRAYLVARSIIPLRRISRAYDNVLAVGLDSAILTRLALLGQRRQGCAYEIHDIRDAFLGTGIRAKFCRLVERWVLAGFQCLIATSPGYFDNYYHEFFPSRTRREILIENKLVADPLFLRQPPKAPRCEADPIRIGYFGMLRCQAAINVLSEIAGLDHKRFQIVLRGVKDMSLDWRTLNRGLSNFQDLGSYADPDDFPTIYSQIDIIWAAGFNQKQSFAWSRTCRFYVALAFGRPLIVQADTLEASIVTALDIGLVIDLRNPEKSRTAVGSLSHLQIRHWMSRIALLDQSKYMYVNEHFQLMKLLTDDIVD